MWKITTQQRSAQKRYPSIVTFGEFDHFQYVTKVGTPGTGLYPRRVGTVPTNIYYPR